MKYRYNYFKYQLPEQPAEYYVDRVVPILKYLKANFPKQFKESFRCPSEVLTLSGVRAFDTYYDLGKGVDDQLKADLKAYLRSKDIMLVEETFGFAGEDNIDNRFSLVHLPAMAEIPERYGTIPEWVSFDIAEAAQDTDFYMWWLMWKERIGAVSMVRPKGLVMPLSWYSDWSNVHNITFGMLLGYPGEAICSAVVGDEMLAAGKDIMYGDHLSKEELAKRKSEGATFMSCAKITHMDKYDGAWPRYDYMTTLRSSLHIRDHEKLWSDILDGVYKQIS